MIRLLLALVTVLLLVMLAVTMLPRSIERAREAVRIEVPEDAKKETGGAKPAAPAAPTTPATPTTPKQGLRAFKRDLQQQIDDAAKAREQDVRRQYEGDSR